MNNIQETLFRTIETITESKLNQIKFDKTIEAIVASDSKASSGEYELRYQDLIFTAYSSNNTAKYEAGENVLVLIPDGDMSNRKTIVSSGKKEGEGYVDIEHIIDRVGVNLVEEAENYEINLSTTSDETVGININKQAMIDAYPGKKYLAIGADIYTNINPEDIEGTYGIAIDCVFLSDEGERIPHTFEFNTLNVTGNPFQSRGYKEVQIPLLKERLVEVTGARAFSKGFSAGYEKIKLKQIVVEYVSIREQDKSTYSGDIITPKGTHFKSNALYPDELLELVMEFKQGGEVLKTDAINYKWFVLNAEVNSTDHSNYHPDAGLGWEWLKDENYDEEKIKGARNNVLSVGAAFVPHFSTFKCIATYDSVGVSAMDMVTLVDSTDKIDIEVVSDNGISFVNGIGSTTLTCNVTQNGKPLEMELDYKWSKVKSAHDIVLIQKGSSNKIEVLASTIDTKSTYLCEVIQKENKRPVATGYISLVNVIDGSTQGLNIIGGFRSVLYDGQGQAPDNLVKEGFQFELYYNGEKVTSNIDWVWKIPPKETTLLTIENASLDEKGYQTTTNRVLNLGVEEKFDYAKNDNTIELEVKHTVNGVINTTKQFLTLAVSKMGQNGADGAAGHNGLDGKTYVYQILGGSPTIIYDKSGRNPSPRELSPFELMFSVDGDNTLAREVETVEWTLKGERESLVSFFGKEKKVRSVTTKRSEVGNGENPHIVRLIADEEYVQEKYNNILSARITYKEKTFRETFPISVVRNGTDGLYGLTISTSPSSYIINTDSSGEVQEDISLLLNFDIYRNDNKIENYRVLSVDGISDGMEYSIEEKSLKLTFLRGRDLSDSGHININLEVEGSQCKQSFSFGKAKEGTSSTSYWAIPNASAIVKKWNGDEYIYEPSTISVKGKKQSGVGEIKDYETRFKIELYNEGILLQEGAISSEDEPSKTFRIPEGLIFTHAKVVMYEAGGTTNILDEEDIRVIQEPKKPVLVTVTADNDTIRNNKGSAVLRVNVYKDGVDISSSALKKWKRGTSEETIGEGVTLEVNAEAISTSEIFKCEVTVEGGVYSDSIVVHDTTDPIQVTVLSSNGGIFKNGFGSTQLTCKMWQNGSVIDEEGTQYAYCWHKINSFGIEDREWFPTLLEEPTYAKKSPAVAKTTKEHREGNVLELDDTTYIRKGYNIFFDSKTTPYLVKSVEGGNRIVLNSTPSNIELGTTVHLANMKSITVEETQVEEKATFFCELIE